MPGHKYISVPKKIMQEWAKLTNPSLPSFRRSTSRVDRFGLLEFERSCFMEDLMGLFNSVLSEEIAMGALRFSFRFTT